MPSINPRIDIQLIARCVDRDRLAQRAFFDNYGPLVKKIAHRYARNSSDAKDIFQEAFILIFTKLQQLKDPQKLLGWIKQVTAHAAINYYRKFKQFDLQEGLAQELIAQVDPSEQDVNLPKELLQIIQDLPDGYRLVFNLFLLEGHSHQEISELLNISVSTSRSQLSKAKRLIRKEYLQSRSKKTTANYE